MALTPIIKDHQSPRNPLASPTTGKKVMFDIVGDLPKSLVLEYKKYRSEDNYKTTFQKLEKQSSKNEKIGWLEKMTELVPILDKRIDNLVLEFSKISWYKHEEPVWSSYNNFILTLVTAHNFYTYHILQILFSSLLPEIPEQSHEHLKLFAGEVGEDESLIYNRVLQSIVEIHNIIPLSRESICLIAKKTMPYFKKHVHVHAVFTYNLLLLAEFLPHLRVQLLEIVIANMVKIDLIAPRSELDTEEKDDGLDDINPEEDKMEAIDDIFSMDVDENNENDNENDDKPNLKQKMSHGAGHALDVLIKIMLRYIHLTCHGQQLKNQNRFNHQSYRKCNLDGVVPISADDGRTLGCHCGGKHHNLDSLKLLYKDLKGVFSNIILATHHSAHVQFIVFYILAIRPGLGSFFLEYLRKEQFEDPSCPRIVRRNAMAYIGSLLARGKFIPFSTIHSLLETICSWCTSYLTNQEKYCTKNFADIDIHAPFYYACQTIFYVFAFRYKEYTQSKTRLELAKSLNLGHLVNSCLNPLRMCTPAVVSNFASITRHYDLVYCYTIMENNKRSTAALPSASMHGSKNTESLEMFFPFDPYLLLRSKVCIAPHYRVFDGMPEAETEEEDTKGSGTDEEMSDAEDSFLARKSSLTHKGTPRSYDFTYGTSPGFKTWQLVS